MTAHPPHLTSSLLYPPAPHPVLVLEPFKIPGVFGYEGACVPLRTYKNEVFEADLPIACLENC